MNTYLVIRLLALMFAGLPHRVPAQAMVVYRIKKQ